MPQKKIVFLNIKIKNVPIQRLNILIYWGLISMNVSLKTHIDFISNKISRTIECMVLFVCHIPISVLENCTSKD